MRRLWARVQEDLLSAIGLKRRNGSKLIGYGNHGVIVGQRCGSVTPALISSMPGRAALDVLKFRAIAPNTERHSRNGRWRVTDRLWEMGDVVDMLDAFEARRKREPKVIFEIDEWKITGGFYVRATLADGTIERIEGFATSAEAATWIKNESVVWLHAQRNRDTVSHSNYGGKHG